MKLKLLWIVFTTLVLIAAVVPLHAQVWDVRDCFSVGTPSHDVWEIGYRWDWNPFYPVIQPYSTVGYYSNSFIWRAQNQWDPTGVMQCDVAGMLQNSAPEVAKGDILLNTQSAALPIIRWKAPTSGKYGFNITFTAAEAARVNKSCYVIVATLSQDGTPSHPGIGTITNYGDSYTFNQTLELVAGQSVDFTILPINRQAGDYFTKLSGSISRIGSAPQVITYQGKINDASGNPVPDGLYNVSLALFTTSTGGTPVWTSSALQVNTVKGIFTTLVQDFPTTALESGSVWLETTVSGETLAPRIQLTSVPFALKAGIADSARFAAHATDAWSLTGNANAKGFIGTTDDNTLVLKANNEPRMKLYPSGKIELITETDTTGAAIAGVYLEPGGSTWQELSDRNAKQQITPIDGKDILRKLAGLQLATWSYKTQDNSIRHLGPMAQDFHAAFGLGSDSRRISTLDTSGVALAAIQVLYEELTQLKAENERIKSELESVKASKTE